MNSVIIHSPLVLIERSLQFMIVCCLLFVLVSAQEQHVIAVSSKNGIDNDTCLKSNGSLPCQTLNFTLRHFHENPLNSTLVEIESSHYYYSLNLTFSWLRDFTMQVKGFELPGGEKAVISCRGRAGFSFQNSVLISFRGIRMEGCGTYHMSTTGAAYRPHYNHTNFSAAIFIVDSEDVFIESCEITDSPGIGVNLYDVGGTVNLSQTVLEGNGPISCPNCSKPGGGIYIEFTRTGGIPPWRRNNYRHSVNSSFYLFYFCNFTYNHSPQMLFEDEVAKRGFRHNPFGRGGAVSLFFFGSAKSNVFMFEHCNFQNNAALYGAGLFAEFHDLSKNNTLIITDSFFENNTAVLAGGAVRTGSTAKEDQYFLQENKIIQRRCYYKANSAIYGGAVSHYGRKYKPSDDDDLHEVVFSGCTWTENKATVGSAMGFNLDHINEGKIQPFSPFYILVENCTVNKNAIILTEDRTVIGQGSLYSHSIPLIFKGNVHFEDNTHMSAVVLDNALLYVHDKCFFQNNTGQAGGAVGLYGESQIITMKNSSLLFKNNTALEKGGAIYVQTPGPPLAAFQTRKINIHECFLAHESLSVEEVEQWQTNISFVNNYASGCGNSVYATTLASCFNRMDTRLENSALVNWPVVHFHPPNHLQHIGTDPVLIEVVKSHWNVAPSEMFNTTVKLRNERNQPCNGTIQIDVKSRHLEVNLHEPSPLFLIPQSGNISNLQLKGIPRRKFTISFRTLQGQLIKHTIDSTLKECYPGYKLSPSGKSCVCLDTSEYPGISHCGVYNKEVYLKPGFWFGPIKVPGGSITYATFNCPAEYCNNSVMPKTGLLKEFLYKEEDMCAKNRTDTLCGKCKNGTNLLVGSEECSSKCYPLYSLLLLAFAVGAIILILILLFFDLSIFIKYFSCWLFSYQVMEYLKYEGESLDPVISTVIDLANWRLPGVGLCITHGMNNIQKLGFSYVLPLFILFVLMVLAIISSKKPHWYFNREGERLLSGCCVLLVLCYTNVTSISFKLFYWVQLHSKANEWVLFFDGSFNTTSCRDDVWCIGLSLFAALWLLLLFPLPILLALNPAVIRDLRTIRNLCSIFQGCLQQGKEWFASVYFFLRIVIIILAMFLPAGVYTPLKRTALDLLTVAILVMFVHFKPYNDEYEELNKLDAVLLGHLCIFSLLCSNRGNVSSSYMQKVLWYLIDALAYGPLLYFICILLYLAYAKRANLANYWTAFQQHLQNTLCKCGDEENLLDAPTSTDDGY